jgi:DNA-binding sugar fermentation-stimulating protein
LIEIRLLARLLAQAQAQGVKVFAYGCQVTKTRVSLDKELELLLDVSG